ncbi:reverse transcriptase, partial [Phytophthora megakarya]
MEEPAEPVVQRPTYPTPRSILRRAETVDIDRDRTLISTLETRPRTGMTNAAQIEGTFPNPEESHPSTPPTNSNAGRYRSGDAGGGRINLGVKSPIFPTEGVELRDPSAERATATTPQNAEAEDEISYHESGDLSAEDLEGNLAVLPKTPISTTAKVSIEDLQGEDSGSATREEIEKLRQIIWKKQHLLIDKGNALPLAAWCVGLLAAEIIRPSTSPWASPIVIVQKSNGVDIRLCIDYKLVNSLTRLMVYPMPLISDLLEDLDKALWYCSLDMASGFWIVPMTDRAREISSFMQSFLG